MKQTDRTGIAAFLSNGYFHLALRLFVGVTFLLSAVSKLPHHTEFEAVVKDYGLLPDSLATAYANALPWVELLVGVYLVLGVLIKPSAVFAILMGISFMVANISAIVQNKEHCGSCFGETFTLPVWEALTIDVFLLVAAGLLLFFQSRSRFLGLEGILGWQSDLEQGKKANQ